MILETAWKKLYPNNQRQFHIQNAFDCAFLRNLIKRDTIFANNSDRIFFALFDFDEAYSDWVQLGADVVTDIHAGLIKKQTNRNSYALLLPVPNIDPIKRQVINDRTGCNYGNKSLLTIELLFYSESNLDSYFSVDDTRPDHFIKFVSDDPKVTFAKDIVPTLRNEAFEPFRPMFEFIKSKIS